MSSVAEDENVFSDTSNMKDLAWLRATSFLGLDRRGMKQAFQGGHPSMFWRMKTMQLHLL